MKRSHEEQALLFWKKFLRADFLSTRCRELGKMKQQQCYQLSPQAGRNWLSLPELAALRPSLWQTKHGGPSDWQIIERAAPCREMVPS